MATLPPSKVADRNQNGGKETEARQAIAAPANIAKTGRPHKEAGPAAPSPVGAMFDDGDAAARHAAGRIGQTGSSDRRMHRGDGAASGWPQAGPAFLISSTDSA
jgi:hypothetical protein